MRTTAENSKFLSVLNNPKSKTANQKLVGRKARAGIFALAAACLLMAWSGHAAEMFVPKAAKPPALDGKISDGEWNGAGKSGKFMILGDPANAATEQTEAFIMRDDENLYVAFRCHESRIDKMKAKVTTRNGSVWEDDDVEFFICEGENPADCRQFVVNSLGAQWDCREGKESAWRAGAFVDTNRWSVEMAIPWTYLGIQPEEGLLFRGNFCRGQKSKAENSAWPAIGSGLFADMENSVRIVFGSYNAAAMRELEGLAGKTEALGVSGELAGEKSGILKEIKGLAEEVKTGKKLTFREWRGVQKRTSDLEGKKTALEAKMISERFAGAAASNKVYLTSDVSRSGYDLPEIWGVRKILNKDFCYNITPREFWEKEEFKNEAFVRESMMRINPGSTREEFEDKFFNPQSPTYQMLKKTDRQFVLSGHDFSGPADMPTSLCRRFLAEYGHRFGGFQSEESFGHTTRERIWKAMALPFPRTRHEAFLGFKASYFAHDNRFRSWSLTYPEFRSWTSTAPATYLDHWILEMGAPYTGQEIGATGYSRELGMCFAFSRGAARQYEKPWRMYLAVSIQGGGLGYTEPIYCYLSPECRRRRSYGDTGKFWGEGPYCGTSLSLQRRQLFVAYMSGVNMIRDENDNHGGGLFYAANYNWRDIDKVDPLVKVMRDKPYHLSQAGEIRKELYDNLFKKHDRGVAYTPVGLVFDRHHGFIWTYSHNKVMGILPYTEGDWMMPAVQSALFPFLVRKDSEARSTGPYGDMFDVLTNNARQETLRAYRALLLVGDVDLDVRDLADPKRKPYMFAKRLMDYVENGGTLMINARQIKAGVFPDSFLGCKITEERGEGQFGYSLPDGEVIAENKTFGYQRLEPVTAIPLILRADTDGKQDALVTVNKCGKGMVIVTAPDYMMPAGGGERAMLNMFKHIMGGWRDELLPVKWTGDVEVLVNRNRNGWVVTLVNNEGVIKQAGQKEEFDAAHDQDVWLRLEKRAGGGQVKNIDEWIKGEKPEMRKTDDGAEVKITVPAGDIRILEFHL